MNFYDGVWTKEKKTVGLGKKFQVGYRREEIFRKEIDEVGTTTVVEI